MMNWLTGRRRQLAVTALPAVLATAGLAVTHWTRQPAAPLAGAGAPEAVGLVATLLFCLALGSLHRPLGGAALGIGTVALPAAVRLLGAPGAAWIGAAGYVAGGLGRRFLRHLSGGEADERRGLGRLLEGAGRSALAVLAAGLAWEWAAGRAPAAAPVPWHAAAWGGTLYLGVFAAAVLGAEALRRPGARLRPSGLTLPLALDAAGWALGVGVARVGAVQGWALGAGLLWGIALLAAEAARLGTLQGTFERRAVDLARVSRASRRMAASGFGLAGLAAQIRAECLRVLDVQWFQLEVFADAADPAPGEEKRRRSWWAGPDGGIHGGVPDPGDSPPPLPGIHRRLPWRTVARDLESGGRRLARLRLWLDPRRVRSTDLDLLDSLLPQLAAWVHRALLDREAREDALTGVPTRRHLERVLAEAFSRVLADGGRLAVVLADLDHFKAINDTHGHPAGDRALVAVARTLEVHRRATDTCARYGGEEFALVLDGADGETALAVAERLRCSVECLDVEERGQAIPLSVSLGVAAFPELWASAPGELLALADEALYEAKHRGRNRVLLNLGRGRYRQVGGDEIGGEGRPVEAPRIFA
jgi:diguanylate cyclase (GGDEF)-like protein